MTDHATLGKYESNYVSDPQGILYSRTDAKIDHSGILSDPNKRISHPHTKNTQSYIHGVLPGFLCAAKGNSSKNINQKPNFLRRWYNILSLSSGWYSDENGEHVYFRNDVVPLVKMVILLLGVSFLLIFILPQIPLRGWKLHFLV